MELATFRHFCTAARVLEVYQGSSSLFLRPKDLCEKLKEAVVLSLRSENVRSPDHQHRNRVSGTFIGCEALPDMLLKALGADSDHNLHCLEWANGNIYVCANHLEQWQREVTAYQSPVPVMAAAWVRHCRAYGHEETVGMTSFHRSLTHSTLPGIHDKRLHDLTQRRDGTAGHLCDLHIHINGSTEFTPVWLHSLSHQDMTCKAAESALKSGKKKVAFFHKQLRTDLRTLCQRLRMAARVRFWICSLLRNHDSDGASPALEDMPTINAVASLLAGCWQHEDISSRHPFEHTLLATATDLQREGAMWLHALWLLHDTRDHLLAVLLHVYLLLMHQHLRLLVQQPEQHGFDQFQYITMAGGREAAEAANNPGFTERFRQFHGMYGPDIAHVEARFSPKDSPEMMCAFLVGLWNDYLTATDKTWNGVTPCSACPRIAEEYRIKNSVLHHHADIERPPQKQPFSLGLVAHFIKGEDDDGKGPCRHRKLRDDIQKKAQALVATRQRLRYSNPALYRALLGKDAASNELDAPPEVFSPTFRYLDREGITRTTYHAGEDFEHMLCGMRAVYEAMYFLNMRSGDRIGHATALGIEPAQCDTHNVYCAQGQWLDSLVWLTWLIHHKPELRPFNGEVALLNVFINQIYMAIYDGPCPQLPVLWKAWELRKYDARMLEDTHEAVHPHSKKEREAVDNERAIAGSSLFESARKELIKYHCGRKAWKKNIKLTQEKQPCGALLQAVQDAIVLEMRKKNILVEVLPTSNVRISYYHATEEHHVMRWLDSANPRPAPQVVLGTDDPGIFSTTLRNEYSFILHRLQKLHPGRSEKPYEIIEHLIENGLSYRFMPERV